MNVALLLAIASLVLWVFLAFVAAIPSGWAHLPLAVGSVLLVIGIVQSGRRVGIGERRG